MPVLAPAAFVLLLVVPLADPVTTDPLTVLINYGGLAGAFALVIIGRLRTPAEVAALNARIDSLEKQLGERDDTIEAKDSLIQGMVQAINMRTLPALASTSSIIEQIPQTESALASLLRESLAKTEALTARLDARGAIDHRAERDGQ